MNIPLRRSTMLLLPTLTVFLAACGGEGTEAASESQPATETAPAEAAEPSLLDPNTATREQLLAVDGLTEPAVDALIAARPYDDMLEADAALELR